MSTIDNSLAAYWSSIDRPTAAPVLTGAGRAALKQAE